MYLRLGHQQNFKLKKTCAFSNRNYQALRWNWILKAKLSDIEDLSVLFKEVK